MQRFWNLRKYDPKFDCAPSLTQQEAEVFNLVLNESEIVEFELRMANAAYQNNGVGVYGAPVYLPDPTRYLAVDEDHLAEFFSLVQSSSFNKTLQTLAADFENGRPTSTVKKKLVVGKSYALFMQLMHFTLSTSPGNLSELSKTWYTSMKMKNEVRVFHCSQDENAEETFAAKPGTSDFYFHGTWENCVYSILRNGMRPSVAGGIWMAKSVDISWSYARSTNKLFFCYEAKTKLRIPIAYGGFPSSHIIMRAVIWVVGDNYDLAEMIANNLNNDLKNRKA